MNTKVHEQRLTQAHIAMSRPSHRRSILRLLGDGVLGAAAAATGVGAAGEAWASVLDPPFSGAQVFIGSSPDELPGSLSHTCTMFHVNGRGNPASHTLDLQNGATGSFTYNGESIFPDFSPPSNEDDPPFDIAVAVTTGSDPDDLFRYLLVAGEGPVTGAVTGYLAGVTHAIFRCKYKVKGDSLDNLLLVACMDCVIVLLRR